jgi:hypothetical protein
MTTEHRSPRRSDHRPVWALAIVLAAALAALWLGGPEPFALVLAAGAGLIEASTRIGRGHADQG